MAANLSHELAILAQANRELADARSLEAIRCIRDRAVAARNYARSAALGLEVQNLAAEVKLRAERKAGRLLTALRLRGGDRRSNMRDAHLKLGSIGVNYSQSARWQLEASIPDEVFERYILEARRSGKELTAKGLLRLGKAPPGRPRLPALGKNRKSAVRNAVHGQSPPIRAINPVADRFIELRSHFGLLRQVIHPLFSDQTAVPKKVERRVVLRLISDIEALLAEIDK
jgi:hypothetical protein